MNPEIELLRSERRSFFCPNKLWREVLHRTGDCASVSTYVRQAITEKMIRETPNETAYIRSLATAKLGS